MAISSFSKPDGAPDDAKLSQTISAPDRPSGQIPERSGRSGGAESDGAATTSRTLRLDLIRVQDS
jgi:hypothetical protein